MWTLVLQALVSLLLLAFGLVAWRIARVPVGRTSHVDSWGLTASTFILVSLISGFQNAFGTLAYLQGQGAIVWDWYMVSAPSLNHSRTIALLGFFLVLPFASSRPLGRLFGSHRWLQHIALVAFGAGIGALVGLTEDGFSVPIHFKAVATLDVLELLVVLAVLFFVLMRNLVDQLLWFALSVYAFSLALNAIWTSALIGYGVPSIWTPPALQMHVYRVVLASVMLLLGVRRLALGNASIGIPGLMETIRPSRASSHP